MSERAKNQSVVILGVITAAVTLFIQIVKIGEVKATITVMTNQHEERLKSHDKQIGDLNHSVSRIEGHLGLSAEAARPAAPPVNVARHQPNTSGPYSTP